jgi:hypothetical protein
MLTEDFNCPPELQRFLRYRPEQLGPTPANLRELEQLLYGIWGKQSGKTEFDQKVLAQFQTLCGLDETLVAEHEQRVLRSLDKKQPILVGLGTNITCCEPGRPGVLIAWVMNSTASLFREVRVRFRSAGLSLVDNAQPLSIKLLESRDALPVYLHYEAPSQPLLTTLALEVDICDHHGEWRAYNNRSHILLSFPGPGGDDKVRIRATHTSNTASLYSLPSTSANAEGVNAAGDDAGPNEPAPSANQAIPDSHKLPSWEHILPVELELEPERTHRLQAKTFVERRAATRGTPLNRALLRSQNPAYAPERIELVSRPFIVCGRHIEASRTRISDFSLGFLPGYEHISRLHCAICACEDGLAVLHTGRRSRSYTAVNGKRLPRGQWLRLQAGDSLTIGGLYDLQVVLAWDVAPGTAGTDEATPGQEQFGNCLLEIVDLLDQLQGVADTTAVRQHLKTGYNRLVHLQNEAARHNGVNSLGPLLYARLQRQDPGQHRVVHVYLPKWLSIGSSSQAGLCINAEDVAPQHAELLFKDGMYWIQNRVDQGGVWVCNHSLAPNEAVPLEEGDTISIGSVARFVLERY